MQTNKSIIYAGQICFGQMNALWIITNHILEYEIEVVFSIPRIGVCIQDISGKLGKQWLFAVYCKCIHLSKAQLQ